MTFFLNMCFVSYNNVPRRLQRNQLSVLCLKWSSNVSRRNSVIYQDQDQDQDKDEDQDKHEKQQQPGV